MIAFRRVIIVVLENASRDTVLTNAYMRDLRRKGVFLSNSHCVTHPSQPNYFTMVAGDTLGMVHDNSSWVYWTQVTAPLTPPPIEPDTEYPHVTCIVDLLEAQGLSWKAYAEDYNAEKYLAECKPPITPTAFPPTSVPPVPTDVDPFARRHVPFLCFPHIVNHKERAANIVEAKTEFEKDIRNGTLPHYSFYTPNLKHDGHDGPDSVQYDAINDKKQLDHIEEFLIDFLGEDPVSKFPPETLIVITFDESYGANVPYNIYTLLIGDMLKAGTVCNEPYNHYSLLRTIEDNFGLGTLGRNDAAATPYWFVRRDTCK